MKRRAALSSESSGQRAGPVPVFPSLSEPPFPRALQVLQVDDSAEDAQLALRLLQKQWKECELTRVQTPEALVEALDHQRFDVILSDYSMPGFDGLSALDIAHAKCPEVPYIFLSGTIGEDNASLALQHGASDYIAKDRPARLVLAVRRALEQAAEAKRRAHAEGKLERQTEWYDQIIANLRDLVAVVDLDGRRVYTSPAYEQFLGSADELRGSDAFLDIHPDDRERVRAAFAETASTGRGWAMEYRLLARDGSVRHLDSTGSVIRLPGGRWKNILVVSHDATARRLAEGQVRIQASLLNRASDAIIAVNDHDVIAFWNASAERLYGWSGAEVLDRPLAELGLGHAPARYAQARAQARERGDWRGQFELKTRSGAVVQVETTWSYAAGVDGLGDLILFIDTDVTERRRLENELLRGERMDSIGMLAAGIAHDLNNLLTPILMGAGLLRAHPDNPAGPRIMETIERSSRHGAALVRQLLAFARGDDGELGPVPVAALIEDVEILLQQSLPKNVRLVTCSRPELPAIHADATQIKQVLLNLCINARDALAGGGAIVLDVAECRLPPEWAGRPAGVHPGRHVHFSVRDNGAGMPPHVLDKIFDPFFTTKGVGKGTGLGMSTVFAIVRRHGGFLEVASQEGVGTTIDLYFPACEAAAGPVESAPAPIAAHGNCRKILVLDRDKDVRGALELLLEPAGYEVMSPAEPHRSILEYSAGKFRADAVLVDLSLLGREHASVITRLRAHHPDLPLVGMCAVMEPDRMRQLSSIRPPIQVLPKPVDPIRLLETLGRALGAGVAAEAGAPAGPAPVI